HKLPRSPRVGPSLRSTAQGFVLLRRSASDAAHRRPPSFPTRRSSDLDHGAAAAVRDAVAVRADAVHPGDVREVLDRTCAQQRLPDRKSTRLNSSHVKTSYAVFCLKKKRRTESYRSVATRCSRRTRWPN